MNKYMIIVGMAFVTYIPRLLPFYAGQLFRRTGFVRRFMKLIPYTALVALILPGVLKATDSIETSLLGLITAIILAYKKCHVVLVILGSIASVLVYQMIF